MKITKGVTSTLLCQQEERGTGSLLLVFVAEHSI
jgi:hypothetical protein